MKPLITMTNVNVQLLTYKLHNFCSIFFCNILNVSIVFVVTLDSNYDSMKHGNKII